MPTTTQETAATLDAVIDLSERVVVVTGAGRGLGRAYARALASRGAHVVVHDAGVARDGRGGDPQVAAAAAAEIVEAGGSAEPAVQNLATREGAESLVAEVLEKNGRVDALVHNAGIVRYGRAPETSVEEWTRMLEVNVAAAWWLCRAVLPAMTERGYGRIVLTTSGFALRPIPGADVTGYSVGKAAQVGLMNGLAAEGAPHGVLVNCISPVAATRIFRREVGADEMTPESVSPAVVMLASEECRWSGQIVVAQDGRFAFDHMVRSGAGEAGTPEEVLDLADEAAPDLSL